MQQKELKLDLSQTAAIALLKKNPFDSAPSVLQQKSIYFDTAGWDLSKRGLSLCIRQSGNERLQIVEAGDGVAAGSFTREEWERPVADDTPVFDDPQIRDLLGETDRRLAPVFEVHVKRHRWNVTEGETTIAVAVDVGKVVAADREAPLCEIELEQMAGPLAALFALARKVDVIAAAHLGVLSKAQRGYRLLGAAPGAVKASAISLTPDMNAATAFAHIAAACLRQFRLNEMALSWSRNADALHQARVSLRRLRSLFSICRSLFADSRFDHMRSEFRWLASDLGNARNIDVMIARASNDDLFSRLQQARNDAYGAVEASLSSARARSLMIGLAEWISIRDWRSDQKGEALRLQPARDFAAAVLDILWKKVAKGGRNLTDLDDEARHELRIIAKKLRYAAEFFGPLYDSKKQTKHFKPFLLALEGLQDHLGSLNDLATAPAMLSQLNLSDVAGAGDLFSAADKKKLLQAAGQAHVTFVDTRRFWR
jgi:triphosphatase